MKHWQRGSGMGGGKESLSIVLVAAVAGSERTLGVGLCVPCVLVSWGHRWPSEDLRGSKPDPEVDT